MEGSIKGPFRSMGLQWDTRTTTKLAPSLNFFITIKQLLPFWRLWPMPFQRVHLRTNMPCQGQGIGEGQSGGTRGVPLLLNCSTFLEGGMEPSGSSVSYRVGDILSTSFREHGKTYKLRRWLSFHGPFQPWVIDYSGKLIYHSLLWCRGRNPLRQPVRKQAAATSNEGPQGSDSSPVFLFSPAINGGESDVRTLGLFYGAPSCRPSLSMLRGSWRTFKQRALRLVYIKAKLGWEQEETSNSLKRVLLLAPVS